MERTGRRRVSAGLTTRRTFVSAAKAVLLAFALFFLVAQPLLMAQQDGVLGEFRTLIEVIALLKTRYVDPVDTIELVREYVRHGSVNGMLAHALDDPYTRYLEPHAFQQMRVESTGVYGGIGIVVAMRDNQITIVSAFSGTPGSEAGLRGGDRIVRIDGQPTTYMSLDEAVSLMRGPVGAPVELGIERGDPESPTVLEVRVRRAQIEVPTVEKVEVLEPGSVPGLTRPVGYIQLTSFSGKTAGQLTTAIRGLKGQGIGGLILDLRNNPGGVFEASIEVASRFLEGGPVVHIAGRDNQRRTFWATNAAEYTDEPLIVLVNEFSASASEIVAGALRDRGRATVVGTQTFGKGVVQTVLPMRGGAALSLTAARYETAGGHSIHGVGIEPHVVVEIPEEEHEDAFERAQRDTVDLSDRQLRRALEIMAETLGAEKVAEEGAAIVPAVSFHYTGVLDRAA